MPSTPPLQGSTAGTEGKGPVMGDMDASWTIHVTRGRVSLTIRCDEIGATARSQLDLVLDTIRDLAAELDENADRANQDPTHT